METKKIITDELVDERLEVLGFGEKQMEDTESMREAVLKHYNVELTDQFTNQAYFYIHEESTADGYSVFVATEDPNIVNISEDVYYYDMDLSSALEEAIVNNDGDEDVPAVIYVDDLYQDFIDSAIESLFSNLYTRFEEEVIDQLKNEGYEEDI